ncbi:hypothetical protein ILUMI_23789 [Ignelater luminosus]|uniref:Reverse transcriptase domain-containing protein n=1 Tax=Ignelater luminosus TaxID=2038154 RepID=A0A8K0C861_IGNLU|nr:hypothetical protein ILUMI_23789 [Ignelater luminosus]
MVSLLSRLIGGQKSKERWKDTIKRQNIKANAVRSDRPTKEVTRKANILRATAQLRIKKNNFSAPSLRRWATFSLKEEKDLAGKKLKDVHSSLLKEPTVHLTEELFVQYLERCLEDPVLLIIDNHTTHSNLQVYEMYFQAAEIHQKRYADREVCQQTPKNKLQLGPSKEPPFAKLLPLVIAKLSLKLKVEKLTNNTQKLLHQRPIEMCYKRKNVLMKKANQTSRTFSLLLLKRLQPVIENSRVIPDYQTGFRPKNASIEQVRRITDIIKKSLKEKPVSPTILTDVQLAFDQVWSCPHPAKNASKKICKDTIFLHY